MAAPRVTTLLPPGFSSFAPEADARFVQAGWITIGIAVSVIVVMLVFVVRYRRRPGIAARSPPESLALELMFIAAPLVAGAYCYRHVRANLHHPREAPPEALEIRVVARRWSWEFTHPNGIMQVNELIVPVGRPIRLVMTSDDVIHSFDVPELRVQRDIVPGRTSTLWFEATRQTGPDPRILFCSAFCGAAPGIRAPHSRSPAHVIDNQGSNHATMLARVNVVSREAYDRWPIPTCDFGGPDCSDAPDVDVCLGEHLYRNGGCTACHATDPQIMRPAPSLARVWGRLRVFVDGSTALGDEAYVRESIADPGAHVVFGYESPPMPAARYSERQLSALVAYIRSVATPEPAPPPVQPPAARSRAAPRARP